MTRTFLALELNQDLQCHLEGVIRQVAQIVPTMRFVDPSSIHLTLAFLGELDDNRLAQAIGATEQTAQECSSFSYRLGQIGIFGPPRSPRVIWIGIEEPSGALLCLHSLLSQQLEQRNFATEKRPFSPHLTLARIKQPLTSNEQQRLRALLASEQTYVNATMSYPVHSLNVMKSELQQRGAQYSCLRVCSLKKR